MNTFKAPWWLRNKHLQTILPTLVRKEKQQNLICEHFRLSDNDRIELHWTENKEENKPLLILIPGITGNSKSHYIRKIMIKSVENNYKAVCFHHRGSSEKLITKKIYHAGFTRDLSEFIAFYSQNNPQNKIYIIGYSIGSNILLKWLSESDLVSKITACVCVSVPFNLHDAVKNVDKGFSKIYQKIILRDLNHVMSLNFKSKFNYKSIYDFDEKITAKMHGFYSAVDYYAKNSCKNFLKNIKVPVLIIQAKDDPFLSEHELPKKEQLSDFIHFELSQHGGHIGFVKDCNFFKQNYWLEERILRFIKFS